MVARRRAALLEGSEGSLGLRERGFWRGDAEKDDFLEKGFEGERIEEERERVESEEEIWDGILTDLGSWVILVGVRKCVGIGRIEEREREIEAVGGATMALVNGGFEFSGVSVAGFSGWVWVVGSISIGMVSVV